MIKCENNASDRQSQKDEFVCIIARLSDLARRPAFREPEGGGGARMSEVVPGVLCLSCPLFFTSTLPQSKCVSVRQQTELGRAQNPANLLMKHSWGCSAAAPMQKGHRGAVWPGREPCIPAPAYNKYIHPPWACTWWPILFIIEKQENPLFPLAAVLEYRI